MNTYLLYVIIFISGMLLGFLIMGIKLHMETSKLKSYKRELEKESINATEGNSKVRVLESKILVLEKALEKALNQHK